jgi:hypothetical protein
MNCKTTDIPGFLSGFQDIAVADKKQLGHGSHPPCVRASFLYCNTTCPCGLDCVIASQPKAGVLLYVTNVIPGDHHVASRLAMTRGAKVPFLGHWAGAEGRFFRFFKEIFKKVYANVHKTALFRLG